MVEVRVWHAHRIVPPLLTLFLRFAHLVGLYLCECGGGIKFSGTKGVRDRVDGKWSSWVSEWLEFLLVRRWR